MPEDRMSVMTRAASKMADQTTGPTLEQMQVHR
jgi:hypothetical protein